MAEPTGNERAPDAADIAAAARDRGMERLESAKGQLAEGAERVASAVERTADELEGDGDGAISGLGHSVASLMRQLAGGLRERDVEEFARELGALARRNPGVFLAGSVALGFGIARFFKARGPQSRDRGWQGADEWQGTDSWRGAGGWQGAGEPTLGEREEFDADESLDLSANSTRRERQGASDGSRGQEGERARTEAANSGATSEASGTTQPAAAPEDERSPSKSRPASKTKPKPQRASAGGSQQAGEGTRAPSTEPPSTDRPSTGEPAGAGDSAFTGGTGGGALRGGKGS